MGLSWLCWDAFLRSWVCQEQIHIFRRQLASHVSGTDHRWTWTGANRVSWIDPHWTWTEGQERGGGGAEPRLFAGLPNLWGCRPNPHGEQTTRWSAKFMAVSWRSGRGTRARGTQCERTAATCREGVQSRCRCSGVHFFEVSDPGCVEDFVNRDEI